MDLQPELARIRTFEPILQKEEKCDVQQKLLNFGKSRFALAGGIM
jgi:hypothetical protein